MSGTVASRTRNIAFERDVTEHAARGIVDASALIEHAEARASRLSDAYVTDSTVVRLDRDPILEAKEELADARNYLVWWLEDQLDDPTAQLKLAALREIAVAYERLCQEA